MEVAGLVLGGIPIVLYAFDNYKRCLEPGKNYWRYESTLSMIRSHVFVQQEQLDVTLRNIGLVNPTRVELELHLTKLYSTSKCVEFMAIIDNMETIVRKIMDKLDIDMKGKPQWTTESEDRISWEWRRYWNNALKNIFEKAEIPSLESDSFLNKIQASFNQENCDKARQDYVIMHDMLSKTWTCNCQVHRGNIRLDWHTSKIALADRLLLTVPLEGGSQWNDISVNFQIPVDTTAMQLTNTKRDISPPVPRAPSPSKRDKLKEMFSMGRRSNSSRQSLTIPIAQSTPLQTIPNPRQEIRCLCDYMKHGKDLGTGYITDQNTSNICLLIELAPPASQPRKASSLSSFLGLSKVAQQHPTPVLLSRKQRFSIAAAAVWAILYLYGSPWMNEDWGGKEEIQLFVEGTGAARQLVEYPALECTFKSITRQQSTTRKEKLEVERFQSSQIRNKELFALGILLIELCLGKTFEQIRQESQDHSRPSASLGISSSPIDDFEIANRQTDSIYLEAGDLYGYAVQRCLRCEFPGRDVTKTFEFSPFRQNFFNGVVAPIQATYEVLRQHIV
ncbi:hypothetical protein NPX13_g21 [Xylaria arbuscula]|uniref:DUF7580 domain-containing protein n=1 Tax=Xylaria arbuscula TaxID=114810 RepID=A0A9W8NPQ9_9PEZI|nr:hypothetical protein NPX13_g21 [Xylaria arbuscula]